MVEAAPGAGDRSRVRQHAETASNLREIASGDVGGWLVANAELETGRAPIDELNRALRLDDTDSSVDVLGDDITAIEKSTGH